MEDSRDQLFPGSGGPERHQKLVLEFESFRDFIQIFSPMVSEEGMFVAAEYLGEGRPAVDEVVDFEVRLSDDFRLVNGRGEVAWERKGADGGVAVRFLDLDEPSKRLVTRLVTNFVKDGGTPFSVGSGGAMAAPASPAAEDSAVPAAKSGPVEAEELAAGDAEELFSVPDLPVQGALEELPLTAPSLDADEVGEGPAIEEPDETLAAALSDLGDGTEERLRIPEIEEPMPAAAPAAEADETMPGAERVAPFERPGGLEALSEPAGEILPSRRRVIPQDIAAVAEEISGSTAPPPVEMPSPEEQTAVYSSAASSGSGKSWRVFALASVAGVALGVAAWFLAGDELRRLIGLDSEPVAVTARLPAPPERQQDEARRVADAAAESAPAAGDAELETAREAGARTEQQAPGSGPAEGAVVERPDAQVEPTARARPEEDAEPAEPAVETPTAGAEEVTSGGATAVEGVSFRAEGGSTVVAIRLNGRFSNSSYEVVRVREGDPREVIKLRGISRPMIPAQVEVGSEHVVRLRSGLHGEGESSELHVVADLTGPAVAVTLVRLEGRTLLVTFS